MAADIYKEVQIHVVDVSDDFFGCLLNCAIRYAVGRRSYMPSLVIQEITPLLPQLSGKTLWCFDQDLTVAAHMGGYGDPLIDAPQWHRFHEAVREERLKRGENLYQSCWEKRDAELLPARSLANTLTEWSRDDKRIEAERLLLREAAILLLQLANENQTLPVAFKTARGPESKSEDIV